MPGPGPKWTTSVTDLLREKDFAMVRENCDGFGFTDGDPSDQRLLAGNNTACRTAGLVCDWPALRARGKALNRHIVGYSPGTSATPERLNWKHPQYLRAWAHIYAPDLIDATAEQPSGWSWW